MKSFIIILVLISFYSCKEKSSATNTPTLEEYHSIKDTGIQTGGIRMIPIETPKGTFKVWTKRIGNNPRIKLLLLHGGPAMTHEYFECFESFFPKEGIEIIEYDQL
ncbi:MAG TPA: proline iminopeptidase, partial [Segetibacter sp.]